jgi:hypothetical protein
MENLNVLEQIKKNYITMKRKKEFLKTKIYNMEIGNVESCNVEQLKELKAELNILKNEIIFFESNIICYL